VGMRVPPEFLLTLRACSLLTAGCDSVGLAPRELESTRVRETGRLSER
jgi:hypothetical protein